MSGSLLGGRGPAGYRVATTAETLARILPLAARLGITRIADLTGLDVVGVPTAAAIRPNSRTVASHQGKGLTRAAAKVSAIMEAAEAYHAETVEAPLHLARADELGRPGVDPRLLPLARPDADPAAERLLWIEGRDLATGGARLVPWELVHADYTAPLPPGSGLFQATTNGLGAGNVAAEAIVHAACELIENDAVTLWHAAGAALSARSGRLDLDTVTDPAAAGVLRCFAEARAEVAVWDVTSDVGVATFLCLVAPHDGGMAGIEPEIGSGCHPDPACAVLRALTEAAQARLARISGTRDDFPPESYAPTARAARRKQAGRWLAALGPRLDFGRIRNRAGRDLDEDLEVILGALGRAGCGQAVWVDLTQPALGIPVGRAVVPGLEGPAGGNVPGARARAAAR